MKIENGSYRTVILIGKYAIKIPNGIIKKSYTCRKNNTFKERINDFIYGWFNNRYEYNSWLYFKDYGDPYCPILFSFLGSLIIVMPRCKPVTQEEFATIKWHTFTDKFLERAEILDFIGRENNSFVCVGHQCYKINNIGWLNGKVVCVDYGYPYKL